MSVLNTSDNNSLDHVSVMLNEVLEYLDPQPGKTYVDVTFGSGGHTKAILEKEPTCKVIAFDWDAKSLEKYAEPLKKKYPDRFSYMWGNFAHLYLLLKKIGVKKVDGILADFGTSHMQIKDKSGFSVYVDSDLDMRMSPAHQQLTAAHVLKNYSEQELTAIFKEFGQEKFARKVAKAIVERRKTKVFKTTKELAGFIEDVQGSGRGKIHPATRVFQALRIYVNKELENIHSFFAACLRVLAIEGRLVCISFHSLEDRLVKYFFKDQEMAGVFMLLSKKAIVPTEKEIAKNAPSRSAKLRAAVRVR